MEPTNGNLIPHQDDPIERGVTKRLYIYEDILLKFGDFLRGFDVKQVADQLMSYTDEYRENILNYLQDSVHFQKSDYAKTVCTLNQESSSEQKYGWAFLMLVLVMIVCRVARSLVAESFKNEEGKMEFDISGAFVTMSLILALIGFFICMVTEKRNLFTPEMMLNFIRGRSFYGAEMMCFFIAISKTDPSMVEAMAYITLPLVVVKDAWYLAKFNGASFAIAILAVIATFVFAFESNNKVIDSLNSGIIFAIMAGVFGFLGDWSSELFLQDETKDLTVVATMARLVDGTMGLICLAILYIPDWYQNEFSFQESIDPRSWNHWVWTIGLSTVVYTTSANLLCVDYGVMVKAIGVNIAKLGIYFGGALMGSNAIKVSVSFTFVVLIALGIGYVYIQYTAINFVSKLAQLVEDALFAKFTLCFNVYTLKHDKEFSDETVLTEDDMESLKDKFIEFENREYKWMNVDSSEIQNKLQWRNQLKKNFDDEANKLHGKIEYWKMQLSDLNSGLDNLIEMMELRPEEGLMLSSILSEPDPDETLDKYDDEPESDENLDDNVLPP